MMFELVTNKHTLHTYILHLHSAIKSQILRNFYLQNAAEKNKSVVRLNININKTK